MSSQDALIQLQNKFCISSVGGDIRVLDREQIENVQNGKNTSTINFYSKPNGEILIKRYLESLAISSKPSAVINDFWISPNTLEYTETAFTPKSTSATTLNFWRGHTVTPTEGVGGHNPIADFIFEVICSLDKSSCRYLLYFLSHMLQKPQEKPGVVPVLIGGQGTGKGVFFQLLKIIWARTTLLVNNVDEVVGQFNASLERNYIVCMDEALFSGDRKSLDRLKSMVTEPEIRIEEKYQPTRSIDSCHRFFAATNHDHFSHIEKDDRRFFFLRVSSDRQKDTDYFSTLCKIFEDGDAVENFVFSLLNFDLEKYDVRKRPETKEHKDQKLKSLKGFERYWYEVLVTKDFSDETFHGRAWEEPIFMPTSDLTEMYKKFDRQAGRHESVQQGVASELIKKLCPSAEKATRRIDRGFQGKIQKRGFDLPNIETARKEFETHIGCAVSWEDD